MPTKKKRNAKKRKSKPEIEQATSGSAPESAVVEQGVNNDSRKISFSCLLNDPSEFEGGDLTLMPDSIGYPIKLKQYEICFFPSWMPHKVVPVTKGTRISLVGWVHGPDFV